jgi:hypothetical protein
VTYSDIIGMIGVGLTLLAYFGGIFNWIDSKGKLFYMTNVLGAGLACYASLLIRYWPFVILEGTWSIISFVGWLKAK